jgi:hypothetical protein
VAGAIVRDTFVPVEAAVAVAVDSMARAAAGRHRHQRDRLGSAKACEQVLEGLGHSTAAIRQEVPRDRIIDEAPHAAAPGSLEDQVTVAGLRLRHQDPDPREHGRILFS